jgi:hypothetical protein
MEEEGQKETETDKEETAEKKGMQGTRRRR